MRRSARAQRVQKVLARHGRTLDGKGERDAAEPVGEQLALAALCGAAAAGHGLAGDRAGEPLYPAAVDLSAAREVEGGTHRVHLVEARTRYPGASVVVEGDAAQPPVSSFTPRRIIISCRVMGYRRRRSTISRTTWRKRSSTTSPRGYWSESFRASAISNLTPSGRIARPRPGRGAPLGLTSREWVWRMTRRNKATRPCL